MILYTIRFDKTNKKEICEKTDFENSIDKNHIQQLNQPKKFQFVLDLQKFNNICHGINCILSKYNYFLRVFELKNKFRHLSMKERKKQNIVRQISSFKSIYLFYFILLLSCQLSTNNCSHDHTNSL